MLSSELAIYANSIVDPFDNTITQPKLLDGDISRSSGIRLRKTGQFSCRTGGNYTYVAVVPGLSNSICYYHNASATPGVLEDKAPSPHTGHAESVAMQDNILKWRLVSAGLRLSLMNSAEENDGMWEAVRIPLGNMTSAVPTGRIALALAEFESLCSDMANNPTYQTGKLRDIHRYQFKTGFNAASDIDWVAASTPHHSAAHDAVIIRISGRTTAATPSVLMFDTVQCQEIVYRPGTQLYRLMTYNDQINDFNELLLKTNYVKAAVRIQ